MESKNTANFIFLKDIRPQLYALAVEMEKNLLITPISMLAYSTRFLEFILHDIADLNDYDVNTKVGFVDKVNQLIRVNYLDNTLDNNLPQLLIDAYNERSNAIHSHHIEKSLKEDKKIAFRLNETLFYIADAYYKKITGNDEEHVYIEPGLKSDSKDNPIDIKSTKDIKPKSIKKPKKVKRVVKEDKIDSKNHIRNESKKESSSVEKQKSDEYDHKKDYDEEEINKLLQLLENGYSLQSALKHVDINENILNNWYMDKKSEFIDGEKDSLFIKYNELLIESTIKSIIESRGLGNNSRKVEFWVQYFEEYLDQHSKNLTEDQLKVFNLVFKRNTSKRDKLDMVREQSDINVPVKSNISKEELEKRKVLMLEYIDNNNYEVSLKKSKLPPFEVQKSKKEFLDGKTNNFYHKLSEKLMRRYLIERNKGKSTNQFCRVMAIEKFEVNVWLDNDIFKDFQIRYNKTRIKLFEKAIKNNKSQKEILNELEMDESQFNEFIKLVNDDAEYADVRGSIKKYYSPYLLELFMKEFRKNSDLDLALKNSSLKKKDLESYLKSDKKLSNKYMGIKKDMLAEILITQGKITDEDSKKLDVKEELFNQFEEEIEEKVENKRLALIAKDLPNGMIILTANKFNFDLDDFFDWIFEGSISNNKYSKLADTYWAVYLDYINYLNSNKRFEIIKKSSQMELLASGIEYHLDHWMKWGLINKKHINLTIQDIKRIIEEVKK